MIHFCTSSDASGGRKSKKNDLKVPDPRHQHSGNGPKNSRFFSEMGDKITATISKKKHGKTVFCNEEHTYFNRPGDRRDVKPRVDSVCKSYCSLPGRFADGGIVRVTDGALNRESILFVSRPGL